MVLAILPFLGLHANGALGIEILEWVRYGDLDEEVLHTEQAIMSLVPDVSFTQTLTDDPAVIAALLPGKDVFLVPELDFAGYSGEGITFAPVLEPFVAVGGLLVACAEGFSDDQGTFLKDTGLLDRTFVDFGWSGTADLMIPGHILAEGLGSSIQLANATAWYTTSQPDVEIVYALSGYPSYGVVMYRSYGAGHVVSIGYDYYERNLDADRVIANAVTIPEPATLLLLAFASGVSSSWVSRRN